MITWNRVEIESFYKIISIVCVSNFIYDIDYSRVISRFIFRSFRNGKNNNVLSYCKKPDRNICPATFKVDALSLRLEISLHAHPVGTNTRFGTEVIFTLIWLAYAFGIRWRTHDLVPKSFLRSFDWLTRSELGDCARSLITGLNDGAQRL